ncbi:MAG: hypothetical protein JKY37_00795 [Nannocystaceae bacterium]|nr:hypothetical protein [Nannocystaceae bacterium]
MKLSRSAFRLVLASACGLSIGGCKEDDPDSSSDGTEGADETAGSAETAGADDGMNDVGDPDDDGCIAGGLGCVCADSVCSGVLFCVEDECVQGPDVEFDGGYPDVLAGLRIPVEVDAEGETITWTQSGGPTVELLNDNGTNIELNIPADIAAGETITLTVAVALNGVTLEDSIDITIREATFSNVFPDVTAPEELGTTDGLAFNSAGMWVVSNEGFISRMSPGDDDDDEPIPPGFVEAFELGGLPTAVSFLDNERLLVANTMLAEVQLFNANTGNVATYIDQLEGGGSLGTVSFPLADGGDGDLILSNLVDGQLIYHDSGDADDDDPIPASTRILAEDIGLNPSAMAFGPEGSGIVFVGVDDAIVRIPYDDAMVGMTSTYLDLTGLCGEPDGIAFDEGGNMWVGCPATNSLFVAQYVGGADPSTEVSRSWTDVGAGISRFANLEFGDDEFPQRTLYWTNLEDATVGMMVVGLSGR